MESLTLRSILAEIADHAGETVTAIDPLDTPPGLALRLAPSGARLRLHLQLSPPLLWLEPGATGNGARGPGRRTASPASTGAAPGLASLLRHLSDRLVGARLTRVEQIGLGRVALLHLETRDRIGDARRLTVVIEVMGSFGNLVLIDGAPETGRIVDRLQADRRRESPRPLERGGAWRPPARTKSDLLLDGAAASAGRGSPA